MVVREILQSRPNDDGNPKANYLLYDSEKETMYFQRVAYNHLLAADKVRTAGLPDELVQRLLKGG